MKRLPLALVAVAALAGCGSDDDSANPVQTAKPAGGSGQQIQMVSGNEFNPKQTTVNVGETVTWTNTDSVPHNAVAKSGDGPKSDLLSKGKTYSWTPKAAGKVDFVCTIHPGMEGTINVNAG
jgi:plastocyanin